MQKVVRFLLFVLRLVFSITFIVSGVLKLLDPVGTGLIVSEYLKAFSLSFLTPVSVVSGVFLSVLELVTGIALMARLRIRFFSATALCMTGFFTILTFILFKFSPIEECGCFGEAIHLTNGQTFMKNLILLICIIPVFLYRRHYAQVAGVLAEWLFLGFHAVLAAVVSISLSCTHPLVEFGDFRPGADIRRMLDQRWSGESEDVYVYEKDGRTRDFLLSEIPDSSWHFVEVKSQSQEVESSSGFDFAVSDLNGRYVTDTILNHAGPVFLFSVYDREGLDDDQWNIVVREAEFLKSRGILSRILATGMEQCVDAPSNLTGFTDYKTLISLSRANGGVVLLNSGVVVDKGYCGEFSDEELLSMADADPDEIISESCINGHIFMEIIFILLIVNVLLFRFVCGILRDRKDEPVS